jgi:hypothetical protein
MSVRVVITAYSGFLTQPTVAVPQPQGQRERPALRLVP